MLVQTHAPHLTSSPVQADSLSMAQHMSRAHIIKFPQHPLQSKAYEHVAAHSLAAVQYSPPQYTPNTPASLPLLPATAPQLMPPKTQANSMVPTDDSPISLQQTIHLMHQQHDQRQQQQHPCMPNLHDSHRRPSCSSTSACPHCSLPAGAAHCGHRCLPAAPIPPGAAPTALTSPCQHKAAGAQQPLRRSHLHARRMSPGDQP